MPADDARTAAAVTPAPSRPYFADHLANERTHLAYVRTAVALFAFGMALNQFSAYVMERHAPERAHSFIAGWRAGLGMVIAGVVLALWSGWRFDQVTRDIDRGTYRPSRVAMWALSAGVLVLGALAIFWLLWR